MTKNIQLKAKKKMRLGNIIEKITTWTGIKWITKKILGDRCGCEERKEKLNNIIIDRNGIYRDE
jgi:redox-regulated HSP33 family molecular chaperone